MTSRMPGPQDIAPHPWGDDRVRSDITHACPEHPIDQGGADCPTCYGRQSITELELSIWQAKENRKIAGRD
jgi:hypothetical protein